MERLLRTSQPRTPARELPTLQPANGLVDPGDVETCRCGGPLQSLLFVRFVHSAMRKDRKTYSKMSLQNYNRLS